MLNLVPQIEPVTRLTRDHTAIFALLRNGPVILSQHSKPTAVLVDVETWNDAVRRLAYLERLAAGDRALERIRAGDFATVEEVDAGFAALGFAAGEEDEAAAKLAAAKDRDLDMLEEQLTTAHRK